MAHMTNFVIRFRVFVFLVIVLRTYFGRNLEDKNLRSKASYMFSNVLLRKSVSIYYKSKSF